MKWVSVEDKSPFSFTPLILCHEREPYSYLGVWNPELKKFCKIGSMFEDPQKMWEVISIQPTHWMDLPDSVNYMRGYEAIQGHNNH